MRSAVAAAVVREPKGKFNLEDLELDELRPNEARVRVVAVGVCHTDVALRDGVYRIPMPVVLGHEGGGIVEAIGSEVTRVRVGDPVILSVAYDGSCPQCLAGELAYCANGLAENFGGRRTLDGTTSLRSRSGEMVSSHFFGQSSFSQYANVVESSLVPVDRDLPLEKIAWERLRRETPERYESYVDLVPGVWTKMRIEVRGDTAWLYVHGQPQPTLIVNDVKSGREARGAVALWIGPGTVAHFRDLRVTPRARR